MMALTALALAGCLAVASGTDQIRAGDLAPDFPEMATLAADLAMAPAPAPGVVRIFHPAELRRLAAIHGLPSAPDGDICVTRPVAPLEPARLLAAMRREFPEATVELLEASRQPAPQGAIEFPKSGLRAAPVTSAAGALWIGAVRYGGNHRFSIWARVTIAVRAVRVLAVSDLQPGHAITAAQVSLVERSEFPATTTSFPASLEEVIGQWPRQAIRAGQAVRSAWLQSPLSVRRGETVRVAVRNGGALLEFEARAENSGAIGETVYVRNPDSQRRFRARVTAAGRVAVDDTAVGIQEFGP
jgi:flagella basal body P-ring formation protein FlgA